MAWLKKWEPENQQFWSQTGSKIAWTTLILTTISLILSFSTWFVISAIVVRLPQIGFKFDTMQLFWLASMPGLAGGTFRLVHMFMVPIFGTRLVIAIANFLKVIPCIGLAYAVQDPATSFSTFIILAFLAGFGGGDFSSFMPSTSMFFPKRLQGAALGIQAGIGNFGVSLTQFVTPWIIGFAAFGAAVGGPQVFTKGEVVKDIWLQNGVVWYVPLLVIFGVLSFLFLKSVPIKASFTEQLDIFGNKHTWFMTLLYIMTFGSFSGLAATFPMMIKALYGGFPNAPDPLKYAFYGPLIGAGSRVLFGFVSDKTGGAIITTLGGIGTIVFALLIMPALAPTSLDSFNFFVYMMLAIFFFTGIGNASTFRQIPMIFSPRQAGGVLGFTGAIAAYGPFIFALLIGAAISKTGSPKPFFAGLIVFCAICTLLNWWYYNRKGAEKPC
ncbi:MAG: NarK/NasA family nitrate transporter [Deltaproteobacteria bacterium]|nr:NarK/NasA family nitrate transporter [Deltaproteobacteria bacterium]